MPLPAHGPWTLPINGYEVLQISFAYPIDVTVYADGGASAMVRFEQAFDYVEGGRIHKLDAAGQSWGELAVILALRHDRIASATATEDDARLRIEFASGRLLLAGPDSRYESWAVTAGGAQLIALPAGGVAHFPTARADAVEI
jgi:hypothetical protein